MRTARWSAVAAVIAAATPVSASAQGLVLFGNARLGLGYNIGNSGVAREEADRSVIVDPGAPDAREVVTRYAPTDDLRAISRVRFGIIMTGETESGIAFGASIRADNAAAASNDAGQVAGNVFVTGDWGTLTYGDTNAADEQHVGDPVGTFSLTGLGDLNETPYVSNGGGFGGDRIQFANNPAALPTVRYDYDYGGFGVSISTERMLSDVGLGASYTAEFAGGSVTGGVGYYDFAAFTTLPTATDPDGYRVPGGAQWTAGLSGRLGRYQAGVVYMDVSADDSDLEVLLVGGSAEFGAWRVGAFYSNVLTARRGPVAAFDGLDAYGASAQYDLGGGASVNGGVSRTYGRNAYGTPGDADYLGEVTQTTVADFGISMQF